VYIVPRQGNQRRSRRGLKRKADINIGDGVKVKTARFGKQYAKGRPEFTRGKVISIKGKKAKVRYEGGDELYDTYLSHILKLFVHEVRYI
jgi:hypothetical protein